MFHRKVHPESSEAATQNPNKAHKNETKNNDVGNTSGDQFLSDEDIILIPQRATSKRNIRRYKSQSNPTQFTLSSCDSNENREHWIKTDADCKYYTFIINDPMHFQLSVS